MIGQEIPHLVVLGDIPENSRADLVSGLACLFLFLAYYHHAADAGLCYLVILPQFDPWGCLLGCGQAKGNRVAVGLGTDRGADCQPVDMTATAYGTREGQPSCRGMRTKAPEALNCSPKRQCTIFPTDLDFIASSGLISLEPFSIPKASGPPEPNFHLPTFLATPRVSCSGRSIKPNSRLFS